VDSGGRHALDRCIETLYDACLVYKLHKLEDFNVYSNLGGAACSRKLCELRLEKS